MSTLLYSRGECGLRTVVSILGILNEVFNDVLGEVPVYNSIGNWVKKYGLATYNSSGEELRDEDFAQMVDDCMLVGNEKLLITLAIPSEHQGKPLSHSEVKVLDMAVSKSWSGEKIKKQLEKASKKTGHAPKYVISDNASIMNKGIRLFNIPHHRDISHSLGLLLEKTYKEADDFKKYLKKMSTAKAKYSMRSVAYLLPPTQRTIARFINLSNWVEWSRRMLAAYSGFSPEEKKIYSFVPANKALIEELSQVMNCIEYLERECKNEGLSKATVTKCKEQIESVLASANARMQGLGKLINEFLDKESLLLDTNKSSHNNSTDILESLFGKFKIRKSQNKLNGVTSFVLFLPTYTELSRKTGAENYRFKERLEQIRMKDINTWKSQNLSENSAVKRTKILKNVS